MSDVSELRDVVEMLSDELKLLRQVLDEMREELSWANNNARDLPEGRGATSTFRRITSMSADPTARDFQINSVPSEIVATLRDEAVSTGEAETGEPSTQNTLF